MTGHGGGPASGTRNSVAVNHQQQLNTEPRVRSESVSLPTESVMFEEGIKLGLSTIFLVPTRGHIQVSTTKEIEIMEYSGYLDLARQVIGPLLIGEKFQVNVPVVLSQDINMLRTMKGPPGIEFTFNTRREAESFVSKLNDMY